ncbi:MAG: PVC-type heme-binding CxxCH protein [Verrucomicrobiota bacterium]
MKLRFVCIAVWLAVTCLATMVLAAEPEPAPRDLPRIAPTEPDRALSTFRIKPGFRIELVAAEPLVVDPIAMSFDENGRLYVVEMRDYSERRDEHLGRIRLLEDTDGDGRFDKSTVFADNLPWPTAVICYAGGVFIGATPDILFCKDTNGDGVADIRDVIFTGFGEGVARLNVQQLFNSFNWGLDNHIHGASGGNGGTIVSRLHPQVRPLELRGRDFAFEPRKLFIFPESGGGQYGLSYDDDGRKFVCSNSSHIRSVMYEDRYMARNPFFAAPGAAVDIAVDGPAAEVYHISPDEPWRVLRTKWRVAGMVPGPIEGGGRPSGYFTGATGITIYRGNAWPEEFRGDAFVADCGSNLVHRKKLYPDGVGSRAERPADEQKVEFLASTDNWFRPVQMANGPDGALYIADLYREVIEHPWSLPESIKKHLDLNSGNERGRIYRIVPEGFQQPKPPRLGSASTGELVATLEHPNGWHRDTAARLLYERQDQSAIPALEKLLASSKSPLGRLHALQALDGLAALKELHISRSLSDPDARVREHAVLLSERFLPNLGFSSQIWRKLRVLAADPEPRVRYQLAFTLGEIRHRAKAKILAEIGRRDLGSRWIQTAVLSSVPEEAAEVFTLLIDDRRISSSGEDSELLRQLVTMVGLRKRTNDVERVLDRVEDLTQPQLKFNLLYALGETLQRKGSSLQRMDKNRRLASMFARAVAIASDSTAPEATRVSAVRLLGLDSLPSAGETLFALLNPICPQLVQLAAVGALGRFPYTQAATELARRWPVLTPRIRSEALNVLVARPERVAILLNALQTEAISRSELSTAQIQFLCSHPDMSLRARATQLFGQSAIGQRQAVVERLSPALKLIGDPANGKAIYLLRCASCHRLDGQGHALGPDLVSVKSSGKEKLLLNILDPNREVAPNYVNYVVETKRGETLLGLIGSETATSLTLRRANGDESVVLRSDIARIQSVGLSVMPEGLEAGLSHQDVADLLEYISTAGQK